MPATQPDFLFPLVHTCIRAAYLYQDLIRDHDTAVWWQGSPICIFYAHLSVSTPQSCIISWVPLVTMSLQLQLPAASYIFIHFALRNKSRRSRRWWMKCFCQQRKSWGFKFITRLEIQLVSGQSPNVIRDFLPCVILFQPINMVRILWVPQNGLLLIITYQLLNCFLGPLRIHVSLHRKKLPK
jgi:hypothetical protein